MAESATIERDDEAYWHLAKAFMRVLMVETNDALKAGGVKDANVRQQIAARLGMGLGNFFDQYWVAVDGKQYHPFLCFTETHPSEVDSASELGTIQGPAPGVELHPMANDEARWYFEEQKENDDAVPMGYE